MHDIIIIGKGPSGVSAAIYAKRAGFSPLVIAKDFGALEMADKVENYYGFKDAIDAKKLVRNAVQGAKKLKVEFVTAEVVAVEYGEENFVVKTKSKKFEAKNLILACGVTKNKAKIKNLQQFEGRGVSYCAVCDAFFYQNKKVAVLGSGDYAISECKELLGIAKSVTLLTNGEPFDKKIDKKVEVNTNVIQSIEGNQLLEKIVFENGELVVDGLFIALGTASSLDFARKLGILTQGNNIVVDENMQTNIPNLYAIGDCVEGMKQICKAVYDGAKAVASIKQNSANRY